MNHIVTCIFFKLFYKQLRGDYVVLMLLALLALRTLLSSRQKVVVSELLLLYVACEEVVFLLGPL